LVLSALIAPLATFFVSSHATPIDRDLPFVALLVVALAWSAAESRFAAAIECAIPAMLLACAFLTDERLRLMTIGAIVAAAFVLAVFCDADPERKRRGGSWRGGRRSGHAPGPLTDARGDNVLCVVGVALFRWLPTSDLEVFRELLVLAGAFALFAAFRERTPLTLAITLAVAAVTPIHPGRAIVLPFVVALLVLLFRAVPGAPVAALALLVMAHFARDSYAALFVVAALALLVPLLTAIRPLAYATAAALFVLWPWSGVVARALPLAKRFEPPTGRVQPVIAGLRSSQTMTIGIPPRVRRVVVTAFGENIPRVRGGRPLGTITAIARDGSRCARELRAGDVADFGFLRRDQFFRARNPLPAQSPFEVHGYGATAFVKGSGRVGVTCGARDLASLLVTAAVLPAGGRLQIESIELPAR
jgi:hypothetical protein